MSVLPSPIFSLQRWWWCLLCCALAAENIAVGFSRLPHRFLVRACACGEASAAASSGSSDKDRAWRGAWACACAGSCCGCSGLGVLDATPTIGRSCTHDVRSLAGTAAPPVPVPRFRNGLARGALTELGECTEAVPPLFF